MITVTCFKESAFPLLPEITIKNEQTKWVVTKVPENGEFAKSGVKEGDAIESVNGIRFEGMDNNKVFGALSVLTGTVKIVFHSDSAPKNKTKRKRKEIENGPKIRKGKVEEPPVFKSSKKEAEGASYTKRTKKEEISLPEVTQEQFEVQTRVASSTPISKKEFKSTSKRKNVIDVDKALKDEPIVNPLGNLDAKETESAPVSSRRSKKEKKNKNEGQPILSKELPLHSALEECPECDMKFNSLTLLSEHYTSAHTIIGPTEESEEEQGGDDARSAKAKPMQRIGKSAPKIVEEERVEQRDAKSVKNKVLKKEKIKDTDHAVKEIDLLSKLKEMQEQNEVFKNDRAELNELKRKLEANIDLENKLKGLDQMNKNFHEMKNMIGKLEERLENEQDLNKREKDRSKVLSDEIKRLKKNENDLKNQLTESDNRNKDYIAKECKEVDANNELRERLKEMEEENIILNKKVQMNRETESNSQAEKDQLQNIIDDKIVEMDKLINEKTSSKLKLRDLEIQNENLKGITEQQKEALESCAEEIQNKKASLMEKDIKIRTLENVSNASNEKVVKYKGDVSKLMEKISRKEDVIEELQKEKKEVDSSVLKKDQLEKKLKTYQETILQKSGLISKLEDENQKLLKEKIENLPFMEEKKKSTMLQEKVLAAERQNRELIKKHEEEKAIRINKENKERQEDIQKNNEFESRLQDLKKDYENKVEKLTKEKERLEDILQSSTMEAEEKNLLNILKSDVKTLEASNDQHLEKIVSLQMENANLKGKKDGGGDVESLQKEMKILEKYNEDLEVKCEKLENENKESLDDQMHTLKRMEALTEKYEALKSKKKGLKEDLKDQEQKIEKLKAKNKALRNDVSHMTQLQVELKTLKQQMGNNTEKIEMVEEVISRKSKWDSTDDSSDERDTEHWKLVNHALDEVVAKKDKNIPVSDVSDNEADFFDSSEMIKLAKTKASANDSFAPNADGSNSSQLPVVVTEPTLKEMECMTSPELKEKEVMTATPKEKESLKKVIFDNLDKKDPYIRKSSNGFKDNESIERNGPSGEIGRSYPESKRGYGKERRSRRREGNRDRDIRGYGNRSYKGGYERDFDTSRLGGYSNYFKKRYPYRDVDTRSSTKGRSKPESLTRTSNDQRKWIEELTGFGLKSSLKSEVFSVSGHNSTTDKVGTFERSSSTEKPSTSTVDSKMSPPAPGDVSSRLKRTRLQTESNFEKRNIILTEPREDSKLYLEEGELDDGPFVSKKIKTSESFPNSLPNFKTNRTFNQDTRSL